MTELTRLFKFFSAPLHTLATIGWGRGQGEGGFKYRLHARFTDAPWFDCYGRRTSAQVRGLAA